MAETNKKSIAFLFGAGISIPSKIPSTNFITQKIFSGQGVVRGTAQDYFFGDASKYDYDPYQQYIPRITTFLKSLSKELEEYYNDSNATINYEDIYYLVDFIRRNLYGAEKNPAFKYLFKNFEKVFNELSSPIDPLINSIVTIEELLNEVIRYLEYSIILLLSKRPENFEGVKFFKDLLSDTDYSNINLYTLNHDLMIENFFQSLGIEYCDGFESEENGYRFWRKSLFNNRNRINFYKIHGSVDWYYYDPDSWADRRVCKCSAKVLWRDPRKPILLIGTYNKLAKYIESIYLDLFCLFYKTIYLNDIIIIIGYSFGDKAINEKLFNWVLQDKNKMIIIDPNVDDLKDKMWSVLLSEWEKKEKIVPIKESSEFISWSKIKEYLT